MATLKLVYKLNPALSVTFEATNPDALATLQRMEGIHLANGRSRTVLTSDEWILPSEEGAETTEVTEDKETETTEVTEDKETTGGFTMEED